MTTTGEEELDAHQATVEAPVGFTQNTPDWRLHDDGNLYGGAASDILLAEMFGVTEAEMHFMSKVSYYGGQIDALKAVLKML